MNERCFGGTAEDLVQLDVVAGEAQRDPAR
jgi:hypothetical protein